jgi:hypothetical protein
MCIKNERQKTKDNFAHINSKITVEINIQETDWKEKAWKLHICL